jgi:hypothetical protein
VGVEELENGDSHSDFPAESGNEESEKEARINDVQDMINLELEGQEETLVMADAEEVLMGGTQAPMVDFESTF